MISFRTCEASESGRNAVRNNLCNGSEEEGNKHPAPFHVCNVCLAEIGDALLFVPPGGEIKENAGNQGYGAKYQSGLL